MSSITTENSFFRFRTDPKMDLHDSEPLEILAASCQVILEDILRPPLELMHAPITVELETLQGSHHDLRQDIGVYPPEGVMVGTFVEELRVNLELTPRVTEAFRHVRSVHEIPYGVLLETVTAIADIELCQRALGRSGDDVQQEFGIMEDAQDWSENATRAFFSDIPEERVGTAMQSFRSRLGE